MTKSDFLFVHLRKKPESSTNQDPSHISVTFFKTEMVSMEIMMTETNH